ncbi:MAG: MBL fold metallo-hydrolase [Candidatus Lokiarchaeota archaeon]|nr:MBL fold metallo-hydrolase [Candidatus Lokiarchaeota archaeon]MBD3199908.1 MBL fold metallo-hydrolase [Candidatus Lokiarchaeota archaeon]
MPEYKNWFEVKKVKDYLYCIRENLEKVDPRYYTHYTNIFLLIGSEKALLIDTGSGVEPLKPVIESIIDKQELIVVNTHGHFDHIGCNSEFDKVFIHKIEASFISNPVNVSNLKDSPEEIAKNYESKNYIIEPPNSVIPIDEEHTFDLGDFEIKVIHTPGHSPGSISLLTSRGDLFPGDLAHYGSLFLPHKKRFGTVLESLSKLIDLLNKGDAKEVYPAHGRFPVGKDLLEEEYKGIKNIEKLWDQKQKDRFLRSWIIKDENFKYIISRF